MTTRISVVDDHPLVRQGLSQIVASEADMEICGEAEDSPAAIRGVGEANPDAIIVDISLKGANGLELIKNLKAIHDDIPILVFSMHDETIYAQRALRAGAKAYVMKKESPSKVVDAIRKIIQGEIYVSPSVADQVLHQIVNGPGNVSTSPVDRLTDRELEVVQLIGRGLSSREVAESLHLNVKTIESHRSRIKSKLELSSPSELVRFAMRLQNKVFRRF